MDPPGRFWAIFGVWYDSRGSMSGDRQRWPSLLALSVHELRTPVTVAAGYLRMLLQGHGGDLSTPQRTLADHAERSVSRIGALVAELRDLAALESGTVKFERRKVPLFRTVAEAVRQTGDPRIFVQGAEAECHIQGDAGRLRTAFAALMMAGLRARRDDQRLIIDCRAVVRSDRRGSASVRIGDSPARASSTRRADLDEWSGGLGLTMPMARRVIEAHGGHVQSVGSRKTVAIIVDLPLSGSGRSGRTR